MQAFVEGSSQLYVIIRKLALSDLDYCLVND